MNKRVCKEDQIKLIMECRQSGLSDYQWCEQNGIHPGTFYNWVSKLKKRVYWSSFLVTLCSEIMLYIETPLVSYSYSLNEVSHSCTS